jgi:hypothetical protein
MYIELYYLSARNILFVLTKIETSLVSDQDQAISCCWSRSSRVPVQWLRVPGGDANHTLFLHSGYPVPNPSRR